MKDTETVVGFLLQSNVNGYLKNLNAFSL